LSAVRVNVDFNPEAGGGRAPTVRGLHDEFHLAAFVQNLKTMALRLLGPPTDGACMSIA
jgi:hypothetical protein